MIRGTTPKLEFELPFDSSNLEDIHILFCQKNKLVLKKKLTDCNRDGKLLFFKLSQEETLLFDDRYSVTIQVRAKTVTGDAMASDCISVDVARILEDEVI